MTACLLYAKIHKNKAENLLHLMLYFSLAGLFVFRFLFLRAKCVIIIKSGICAELFPGRSASPKADPDAMGNRKYDKGVCFQWQIILQ